MAIRNDFAAGEVLAAADLNDTFGSKLDLAGGKILQIVRATDTTQRSTTGAGVVDANISVTITPQKSDSAIIVIGSFRAEAASVTENARGGVRLTDNSDNVLSGAQSFYGRLGTGTVFHHINIIGYSTPATTSATTYKARFGATANATISLRNAESPAQLYAIEVSA